MAINDNTSYELTGAQVKDLANKIKGKAADNTFVGATSSAPGSKGLVPQPAAGDDTKYLKGDGSWAEIVPSLVEMSYGESNAWAKFIAAYNAGSIVYCRASSNSNPASGTQGRKAFMAYVNNATTPTEVEFQYVRSVSSKTDSQQGDQVFIYKLTNASGGTWTVTTRNMSTKINVSGPITKTFASGANATLTLGASAMTGATSSAAGAAGVVPAPAAGSQSKFLSGAGTWVDMAGSYSTSEQVTPFTWIDGKPIYKKTFVVSIPSSGNIVAFQHGISNLSFFVKTEGVAMGSNGTTARFLPDFYVDNDNINGVFGCAIYGGSVSSGSVDITYGSWYRGGTVYATLYYTKTS